MLFGRGLILKKQNLGYLYLLNTIFFFSTYEVVSKTLVGVMDPFQVNFIRFFIGGFILLVFVLIKNDLAVNRQEFFLLLSTGFLNVVLSMNLLQFSLYIPGSKAFISAVIFCSNPIFVTIFSALIEKERLGKYQVACLITGLAGIIIVFLHKFDYTIFDFKSPFLALLSAAAYGLYTVLGRKVSVRIGSLKMNSYSNLLGSFMLLPILVLLETPVFKFDSSAIPQMFYLSVLVTGFAYFTYFKGLSILGAVRGSLVFFIKPVLAFIIAAVFLGERLTINVFLGTLLIIASIYALLNPQSTEILIKKVINISSAKNK